MSKSGVPKTEPFGLKVGRQVINLGEQRLVGETPWSNVERTFDAVVGTARYKWRKDKAGPAGVVFCAP